MRDYDLMISVARLVYALPIRDVRVEWGEHPETHETGVVVRLARHWAHEHLADTQLRRAGYAVEARGSYGDGSEISLWVSRA